MRRINSSQVLPAALRHRLHSPTGGLRALVKWASCRMMRRGRCRRTHRWAAWRRAWDRVGRPDRGSLATPFSHSLARPVERGRQWPQTSRWSCSRSGNSIRKTSAKIDTSKSRRTRVEVHTEEHADGEPMERADLTMCPASRAKTVTCCLRFACKLMSKQTSTQPTLAALTWSPGRTWTT